MSEPRILLVKTSSLGDVVHLLPALTEAAAQRSTARFDWLVESAFAEIPSWHPAVGRVIPADLRVWRRTPVAVRRDGRWEDFVHELRRVRYDLVIDAQGLLKSAFLASRALGPRVGPDLASAREPLAALAYGRRLPMPHGLHAVERLRLLLGGALGYTPGTTPPGYGLDARVASLREASGPPASADEIVLLHGTTWRTKHWPEAHWRGLAARLAADGLRIAVPWGDETERARAERIAAAGDGAIVPRGGLAALFERLVRARGVVGTDSGLVHLASAAGTPGVALYGPTDPVRTGPWGGRVVPLAAPIGCAPCLARVCRSEAPVTVDADGAALEPPCQAILTPAAVHAALRRRMDAA